MQLVHPFAGSTTRKPRANSFKVCLFQKRDKDCSELLGFAPCRVVKSCRRALPFGACLPAAASCWSVLDLGNLLQDAEKDNYTNLYVTGLFFVAEGIVLPSSSGSSRLSRLGEELPA